MHTITLLHPPTMAIAALCAGVIGLAHAAGRQALTEGMPFTKFSEEDRALMMAQVNQALRPRRKAIRWRGRTTSHRPRAA